MTAHARTTVAPAVAEASGGRAAAAVRPTAEAATPVEFSFATGRRPEESTHVRTDFFDGPLALLLALIEQRQLDVLTVRLGDLAGAYLDALARIETGRLGLISSFVTVCSQLILIKSRALLPRAPQVALAGGDEEADPEEALRQRLIEYRMFRDAGRALGDRRAIGAWLFHREAAAALAAGKEGARPDPGPVLDPQALADALMASVRLVPPAPTAPEVMARTITLEERAAVIRAALRRAPVLVLQELLRDVTDRVVIAVTFLAVLELAKGREVTIDQEEPWGPITVKQRAAQAKAAND
jgi:segregation and condensation protein A